jgi:hypothetical protein
VVVLFLLAFNGQWKLGRDTAAYRGLARSLAAGEGYQFTSFAAKTVYPGYPVVLAGLEMVFGNSPVPPIVLNYVLAALAIIVAYRLIRLHYEQWVAVVVSAGLGINAWVLSLSNDILPDLPFTLASLVALYGWERIQVARTRRRRIGGAVYLFIGLASAAALRPTFWVLALSLVLVCVWGVVRGPSRKYYGAALAAVAAAGVLLLALDPRTTGFSPLAGGYEQALLSRLRKLPDVVGGNAWDMLTRNLPGAFYGGRFGLPITILCSLSLIASSLLLWRRHPLW